MKLGRGESSCRNLNDCARRRRSRGGSANSGIAAEIDGELRKAWFVSKEEPMPGFDVPMDQVERAQKLLLEWDASEEYCARRFAALMPVIAGSLSAVCSPIPHSESNHGISGQDRPDREEYYCDIVIITRPKDGTKRSILYRIGSLSVVDGIEQTCWAKAPQSESTGYGFHVIPELDVSLTEIRTAGVVFASE